MTDERFLNLVRLKLLLSIDGIGPGKILSLLSKFQNFENIFNANVNQLSDTNGINKNLSTRIFQSRKNFDSCKSDCEKEFSKLAKLNAGIITFWDDDYPDLLKKIYYPPLIIYCIGQFSERDKHTVAIVGTRQPTQYGRTITEKITAELVNQYISIVSGMARGIDSIAHQTAIKFGGRTIAVIGSGLDIIYPPENKNLFRQISEHGVVVSEYQLGTKPDAQNFPRRNRIISGLSLGTLLIETKLNGGAMQTAAYAIDQNREVFAIPGNLNVKQSEGPNALIQRGEAKLVTNSEDILTELRLRLKPEIGKNIPHPSIELNLFERKLLSILNNDPKHIDDIATHSSMTISDCLVNLLTLEFKGLIKQLPGKMFVAI